MKHHPLKRLNDTLLDVERQKLNSLCGTNESKKGDIRFNEIKQRASNIKTYRKINAFQQKGTMGCQWFRS